MNCNCSHVTSDEYSVETTQLIVTQTTRRDSPETLLCCRPKLQCEITMWSSISGGVGNLRLSTNNCTPETIQDRFCGSSWKMNYAVSNGDPLIVTSSDPQFWQI